MGSKVLTTSVCISITSFPDDAQSSYKSIDLLKVSHPEAWTNDKQKNGVKIRRGQAELKADSEKQKKLLYESTARRRSCK